MVIQWIHTMNSWSYNETAKCLAALRKLWAQMGNSSLLPSKCWPLLQVIRTCSWRWLNVVAGMSARFSKFACVLFCYMTNHLESRCFPRLRLGKHWDSRKNKTHCCHTSVKCITWRSTGTKKIGQPLYTHAISGASTIVIFNHEILLL